MARSNALRRALTTSFELGVEDGASKKLNTLVRDSCETVRGEPIVTEDNASASVNEGEDAQTFMVRANNTSHQDRDGGQGRGVFKLFRVVTYRLFA